MPQPAQTHILSENTHHAHLRTGGSNTNPQGGDINPIRAWGCHGHSSKQTWCLWRNVYCCTNYTEIIKERKDRDDGTCDCWITPRRKNGEFTTLLRYKIRWKTSSISLWHWVNTMISLNVSCLQSRCREPISVPSQARSVERWLCVILQPAHSSTAASYKLGSFADSEILSDGVSCYSARSLEGSECDSCLRCVPNFRWHIPEQKDAWHRSGVGWSFHCLGSRTCVVHVSGLKGAAVW